MVIPCSGFPFKTGECPRRLFAFAKCVAAISRKVAIGVDPTRRPSYFDGIRACGVIQSHVNPQVAGRLIASSAVALKNLSSSAGGDRDHRADRVAIRLCADQPERQGMPSLGPVV